MISFQVTLVASLYGENKRVNQKKYNGKEKITRLSKGEKNTESNTYYRGEKVMLDRDLAEMYGVETKVFNQSIKRNSERFPKDFMFTLSEKRKLGWGKILFKCIYRTRRCNIVKCFK